MRVKDFILEGQIDFSKATHGLIWEDHYEIIREELLKTPNLFEDTADYNSLQEFFNSHATKQTGDLGKYYMYASIFAIIPGNILSIASFENPHTLVKLDKNFAYFDINGNIKSYPDNNSVLGDMLKATFFFPENEFEQFLTLLRLKFSDWIIKEKKL